MARQIATHFLNPHFAQVRGQANLGIQLTDELCRISTGIKSIARLARVLSPT